MGWVDRKFARLVGWGICWMGKRALDRGDVHEYRHAVAALNAGNSDSCLNGQRCHLDAGVKCR